MNKKHCPYFFRYNRNINSMLYYEFIVHLLLRIILLFRMNIVEMAIIAPSDTGNLETENFEDFESIVNVKFKFLFEHNIVLSKIAVLLALETRTTALVTPIRR